MKRLSLILISFILIFACSTNVDQQKDSKTNETSKEELSIYNLDPETYIPKEFGIFDFVNDDLEVIPLETNLDCIVSYPNPTHIVVEDEFILVGSSPPGMKPGEVLLFSKDGQFRHKFGTGGRGPGEHVGWQPRKIRYYPKDSTVMVYWGGGHSTIQLFDLNGDFKYQIELPYPFLIMDNIERWSNSTWIVTGSDDWGNTFGTVTPADSIRFALFSGNGDIIKEIRRTNYPSLNKLQEKVFSRWSRPYNYNGTWKFNLRGNDTLFSIGAKNLKPDAILTTLTVEFPIMIRVLRETEAFFMLKIAEPLEETMGNKMWELEYYTVLLDKSSGKTFSIEFVDDAFFLLDNFSMYDGKFMEKRFQWRNDRLSFALSPLQWMELTEGLDRSKLRPTIREKLKVLEGLKEDDNLIVFTFTLKDEIDFD
ncbi:MAG: 6-bladed beta-propeller [Bacteroidota bacterium]